MHHSRPTSPRFHEKGTSWRFQFESPYWNTDEVHKKCQELIFKIEDGLSKLPRKCVADQRPPQSGCSRVLHDRPVDCLEVYCFKNSQFDPTNEWLRGKALRFTREDGDLTTSEGINKLCTWIHMYEPTHIWASPDCKHWGGFSRLNMTRSSDSKRNDTFCR